MSAVDVNPADVAIEMLTEALPGFASRFVDGRDAVGIRGALPISATVSRELIMHPLYRSPIFVDAKARPLFDALEPDAVRAARHERQREALRRELEPVIGHIVDEIRRFAIEAVNLEPVIAERERRAREIGRRDGYAAGRDAGRREGRAELLLEWQEAAETIRSMVAEMPGAEPPFGRVNDGDEFGL